MKKKNSNLSFFEKLVHGNGLSRIHSQFLELLYVMHRDSRKKYDPEKEVIYLFKDILDSNSDIVGVTDHSYPISFDEFLDREIQKELSTYISWINEIVETKNKEEITIIINDHTLRLKKLNVDELDTNKSIIRAISEIKDRLSELGGSFQMDKHIQNFSQEYTNSPKVKYKATSIALYLKAWYKYKDEPEFRAKAKREVGPEVKLPADNGLITWEKKFKHFLNHAQG